MDGTGEAVMKGGGGVEGVEGEGGVEGRRGGGGRGWNGWDGVDGVEGRGWWRGGGWRVEVGEVEGRGVAVGGRGVGRIRG